MSGLEYVDLPTTIEGIGNGAFRYSENLEKIVIPNSVTSVGWYIFGGCSKLESAGPIGSGSNIEFSWETNIPDLVFNQSSLKSVTIPEGITTIGDSSFYSSSNLTSVFLPSSLSEIPNPAFASCDSLRNLYYADTEEQWALVKGNEYLSANYRINFNWSGSLPEISYGFIYKEEDGYVLITGYEGTGGGIIIPATLNGLPVKGIGASAFQGNTSITNVSFPDSLTSIGEYAFAGATSLTEVSVYETTSGVDGRSVSGTENLDMTIGKNAFDGCSVLAKVVIPEGVTDIESDIFSNCPLLEEIYLPETVETIADLGLSVTTSENLTIHFAGDQDAWDELIADNENFAKELVTAGASVTVDSSADLDVETSVTITLNANGGSVSTSTLTTGTDGKLTTLTTATRSGYTFDGWYTASTGGTKVTTSTVFEENTTIYAQWTENSSSSTVYTITLNVNGGSVSTSTLTTGTDGKLTSLTTPTRSGYTFDGWYTASTGGIKVTTSTEFTENTTIYAQWTENPSSSTAYTITLHANGGSVSTSTLTTGTDGKLTSLSTPSLSGYTFDGWYTASTGGTKVTTFTVFDENTTIYAQWTTITTTSPSATYTVSFSSNGGSYVANQTTSTSGTLSTLPTATRTGYSLNGWYTESSGGTKISTSTIFAKNTTVYAQWTQNSSSSSGSSGSSSSSSTPTTYANTIPTFDNGTVSASPSNPTYNEKVTLTINPKSGYKLDSVSVKRTSNGSEVTVSKNSDGTYTFTQPYGRVSIDVEFVSISGTTTTTPTPEVEKEPEIQVEEEVVQTVRFSDISPNDWFYEPVQFMGEKELMTGTGNGNFEPHANTTRAMIVTVLHSLAGNPNSSTQARFNDVSNDQWFANPVAWAYEVGVANGVGDEMFSPNGDMTREQLVVMLYGYNKYAGYEVSTDDLYLAFPDNDEISFWAEEAVAWAFSKGLVSGRPDGRFDPKATANRAEVATILKNVVNLYS